MSLALAVVLSLLPALPISPALQCKVLEGQSEALRCDDAPCTLCTFGTDAIGQQALYDTSILYRCPDAVAYFLHPRSFSWCQADDAPVCYCEHLGGEIRAAHGAHPFAVCHFRDGSYVAANTLLHGADGSPAVARALVHNGCLD